MHDVGFQRRNTEGCVETLKNIFKRNLQTYGDKSYCGEWQPDVKYDPVLEEEGVTSPQKIFHTY